VIRRTLLIATALLTLVIVRPAFAQVGAIAYDIDTGRWGVTWNQPSMPAAEANALRNCGTPGCQIRLRIGAGECGALATTANRLGWGTAIHRERDHARMSAIAACQRFNHGECFIRAWDCNR
jgi:hypothetical protein